QPCLAKTLFGSSFPLCSLIHRFPPASSATRRFPVDRTETASQRAPRNSPRHHLALPTSVTVKTQIQPTIDQFNKSKQPWGAGEALWTLGGDDRCQPVAAQRC
ncbi:hypothetical protein CAPTEDRAFT_151095, partial [Capitella teleta]